MKLLLRITFFGTITLPFLFLSGCKDQVQQEKQAPEAAYIVIDTKKVPVINELSGRLESFRNADVRARVPGILEKRLFEEGSNVKRDQTLFVIDPRSYEAQVEDAQATLARAEANFMQADLKYKRYIPLVDISAVSKQEFDDALAAQKQAAADIASAQAALVNARLNLEYATVLAPISGRIGRAMVTEGALVGQGDVTLLAVIQQIDPIYLNLTQSSAELGRLQKSIREGQLQDPSKAGLDVTLIMEDGTEYAEKGMLLFSDITVDPSTGEIAIRARFPNPKHILLPGMFVRGKLKQAINENAITVPKQAVQRSLEGSYVFLLNKNNIAEMRNIITGASHEEDWVVLSGLKEGDQVIVEGLQRIRAGSPVRPVPWEKQAQQKEDAVIKTGEKDSPVDIAPELEERKYGADKNAGATASHETTLQTSREISGQATKPNPVSLPEYQTQMKTNVPPPRPQPSQTQPGQKQGSK